MKHSVVNTTRQHNRGKMIDGKADYALLTAFDTRKMRGRGILQIRIDCDGFDEQDKQIELPEQEISIKLCDDQGRHFQGTISEFKAVMIAGMGALKKQSS